MQLEQAKIQAQGQIEQFKAQTAMELERMKQEAETQRAQMKAQIDAEAKLQIAQMTVSAAEKPAVRLEVEGREQLDAVGEEVRRMAEQSVASVDAQTQAVAQAMQMLADAVNRMNKPKRRMLERGPDGRAMGVIEVEIEEPEND